MHLKPQEVAPNNALRRHMLTWLADAMHAQETGGLSWHWSAYRARHAWAPSKEAIEQFLLTYKPQTQELLLIGGSAGWMMSSKWLSQFKQITIIDIDPLARFFFQYVHGRALKQSDTSWRFERRDALQELPLLLKSHPNALVFFDNVLGQQCIRLKDEALVERLLSRIKQTLKERAWGSIHDVYSGPIDSDPLPTKATLITPNNIASFTCQLGAMTDGMPFIKKGFGTENTSRPDTNSEADSQPQHMVINGVKKSFEDGSQMLLQAVNATGEWKDHLSVEVFAPNTPSVMIPWFFKSTYCHWLQAGFVQAQSH
jgi:hypothetical protein